MYRGRERRGKIAERRNGASYEEKTDIDEEFSAS